VKLAMLDLSDLEAVTWYVDSVLMAAGKLKPDEGARGSGFVCDGCGREMLIAEAHHEVPESDFPVCSECLQGRTDPLEKLLLLFSQLTEEQQAQLGKRLTEWRALGYPAGKFQPDLDSDKMLFNLTRAIQREHPLLKDIARMLEEAASLERGKP